MWLSRFVASICGVRELLYFSPKLANFSKICDTHYRGGKYSKSFPWICDLAAVDNITADGGIMTGKDCRLMWLPKFVTPTYSVSHVTGYPSRSRDRSCDRHTATATRSPPHGHRHTATATRPPPHGHRHTVTATRSPPHGHRHTATATRPPPHGHRHTVTATRSPPRGLATLGRVTCRVMCRVMWLVMCQVVTAPLTMGTYQGPWP